MVGTGDSETQPLLEPIKLRRVPGQVPWTAIVIALASFGKLILYRNSAPAVTMYQRRWPRTLAWRASSSESLHIHSQAIAHQLATLFSDLSRQEVRGRALRREDLKRHPEPLVWVCVLRQPSTSQSP